MLQSTDSFVDSWNSLAHACTWRRTWLTFTPVWFKAEIGALIAIRVSVSRAFENLKGEGFSGMMILYNCICFPCYKFHRVFGEAGKSMGRKNRSSSSSSSQQADEGCPNFTWMGWPCHAKIARSVMTLLHFFFLGPLSFLLINMWNQFWWLWINQGQMCSVISCHMLLQILYANIFIKADLEQESALLLLGIVTETQDADFVQLLAQVNPYLNYTQTHRQELMKPAGNHCS